MFMFLTGHGQKIQRIQLVLQDSFCAEKALTKKLEKFVPRKHL